MYFKFDAFKAKYEHKRPHRVMIDTWKLRSLDCTCTKIVECDTI